MYDAEIICNRIDEYHKREEKDKDDIAKLQILLNNDITKYSEIYYKNNLFPLIISLVDIDKNRD